MDKSNSLVVIQSRFNSSRLPGKALFLINGVPLVVLAAKRAANTGKKVIVATSDQHSDDEIVACLHEHGIPCIRGSLDDTLSRFVKAIEGLPDEALVFRLTADNVLPDGQMLDEMEEQFRLADASCLICENKGSDVPYGVSAELIRAGHLREAALNATSDYEREHVTPYIRNKYSVSYYRPSPYIGMSNFRCTIDTLDDYLSVKAVFDGISNIIDEPMHSLIGNFDKLIYKPGNKPAAKPMTLGSVQFGVNYGITNVEGKPDQDTVNKIIKQAISEGIEYIDTAAAYGESESAIGQALKGGWAERVNVITKTDAFSDLDSLDSPLLLQVATRSSVYRSCMNLGVKHLATVLLHRAEHLTKGAGAVYNELLSLKQSGIVKSIGVSVQSPEELRLALRFEDVEFIQLPFNILDHRWDGLVNEILEVKKRRKLIIHARSSLLQGLLLSEDPALWNRAHVIDHNEIRTWLEDMQKMTGLPTISDLCVGYVNAQMWIDSVVIGVDNLEQLNKNLRSIASSLLSEEQIAIINTSKPEVSVDTLNPATWSAK